MRCCLGTTYSKNLEVAREKHFVQYYMQLSSRFFTNIIRTRLKSEEIVTIVLIVVRHYGQQKTKILIDIYIHCKLPQTRHNEKKSYLLIMKSIRKINELRDRRDMVFRYFSPLCGAPCPQLHEMRMLHGVTVVKPQRKNI